MDIFCPHKRVDRMKALYEKLRLIVPEAEESLVKRSNILQMVLRYQPIGRQSLAEKLQMTERPLRTETNQLRELGLLENTRTGMRITPLGEEMLGFVRNLLHSNSSLLETEKRLSQTLHLNEVHIIDNDLEGNQGAINQMGVFLATYLNRLLPEGPITLAVTGGTTIMKVSKYLNHDLLTRPRQFLVVPARGGMGESVAAQANTISEQLAKRLQGKSTTLYVPDSLTETACTLLKQEPAIQHTLEVLRQTNVLLFSVGDARIMAERRGFPQALTKEILAKGAVGEAFGCFYTEEGEIVYRMPRIGLQLEQLTEIEYPILIAGGCTKSKAVKAFAKVAPNQFILVTDRGVSHSILNEVTH